MSWSSCHTRELSWPGLTSLWSSWSLRFQEKLLDLLVNSCSCPRPGSAPPHLVSRPQVLDQSLHRLQTHVLLGLGDVPEEVQEDSVLLEGPGPTRTRVLLRHLHHVGAACHSPHTTRASTRWFWFRFRVDAVTWSRGVLYPGEICFEGWFWGTGVNELMRFIQDLWNDLIEDWFFNEAPTATLLQAVLASHLCSTFSSIWHFKAVFMLLSASGCFRFHIWITEGWRTRSTWTFLSAWIVSMSFFKGFYFNSQNIPERLWREQTDDV